MRSRGVALYAADMEEAWHLVKLLVGILPENKLKCGQRNLQLARKENERDEQLLDRKPLHCMSKVTDSTCWVHPRI